MRSVYLDNAATTPIDPQVVEAILPYLNEHFGNPSSIHHYGRKTKAAIEVARRNVAKHLNVSPGEIVFTSGGTEADNLAIVGSIRDLDVEHIITSSVEHHAVLHTVEKQCDGKPVKMSLVKLNELGHVDLSHLEELLKNSSSKTLVSLMHANNEIGNLLPLKKVGDLCKEYNAYFHSDTVQTMGHFAFDLQEVHVHFITCSAHKFHGPKGVGFLYIHPDAQLKPQIYGGAQERNMRGGTENLYGIVGLSKALDLANEDIEAHQKYILGLKNYMRCELKKRVPGIQTNGCERDDNLYTVLNVCFPKCEKGEMLLQLLDIHGIASSGGSACSSGSDQGSHVLKALGVDSTRASVRFSFSRFTTQEEIDYTLDKIQEILN